MGLMDDPTSGAQLVLTPHPVTLDGQRHLVAELAPGELLGPYLRRVVPGWADDAWEVRIDGVLVPVEVMERVRPKPGAVIEVRGIVKRQVLAIVAIAALAYFTMGAGLAAYGAAVGVTSAAGLSVLGAVTFAAGATLINKVLGPKAPGAGGGQQTDPVYSIGAARNAARPYDPLPLLFGTVRITPDVASAPYAWYEGNDQYLGMVLTPGLNVHSIEALYNGDTALSSYEGVSTYLNGLPGHADQDIPLFPNADTTAGGELEPGGAWVERTGAADTVQLQLDFEGVLYDIDGKGRPAWNKVTIAIEYREVGAGSWTSGPSLTISNNNLNVIRRTVSISVPRGQYEVRAQCGTPTWNDGSPHDDCRFTWVALKSIQYDDTDYTGIPRIGIKIKATGQLNGPLDEVRCVAHSRPVPVWDGDAWSTEHTSNPGAHLLAYARGIYDINGRLLAGIGLADSQIDIPALQAFMLHCEENGYTYDAYIKDARTHQQMVNAIALAGFGQVSWAGGKFSVVWAADGQPITSVVNMANIKRASFQVDYTLASGADGIEATYVDGTDWEAKTLRVEAPGVATMQNPARITLEGVTSEEHAAKLARYHLAQHLYQYKDISFAQDLEHLSYQRMSVLALSHDLTQWGYGGRVLAAEESGGTVTITLDQPVPAPTSGNAYVGLRIPGEGAYRVFQVDSFAGESDTLTLVGEWPEDAAFPGDDADNPAHDTLWIYDFKATPGYRVRVVQVEPEGDLRGARVAVVPESPEFWVYVETGQYTPPAGGSQLLTRPVASNLQISELQTVQGDTVFTELGVTFDVTGPMSYATVHLAQQLDGDWSEVRQVAETRTQQARFRIPGAGVYSITVRPYNADGIVGGAVSATYVTTNADIPPPPFDSVSVTDAGAGVRKYSWAYDGGTIQAPDFAGAEVRYIAGTHAEPDWSAMSPVVGDGFHTAPFEALAPVAGTYTFAFRARNTAGELSGYTLYSTTLSESLEEQLDDITLELVQQQLEIDQAVQDAALAALQAAEVAALAGTAWDADTAYDAGDVVYHGGRMYQAKDASTGEEPPNATYWTDVGSITQAQGNTTQALSQLRTDVDDAASAITQVRMTMPGSGNLLPNSDFALGLAGWVASTGGAMPAPGTLTLYPHTTNPGPSYIPQDRGGMFLRNVGGGALPVGSRMDVDSVGPALTVPVEAGKRYMGSAYLATHRCQGQVYLQWLDSNKNHISYSPAGNLVNKFGTGGRLADMGRSWAVDVAPPTAAFVVLKIRAIGTTGAGIDSYLFITSPMIEECASATQDVPSPYSVSAAGTASVTQQALVTANSADGRLKAMHTVALDVNGHVSGTINENDGQTSSFSILATVFRVISTLTGMGMEWQDGYLRIWRGTAQLVIGHSFGSGNLVFWYGPNVGAGNCTKANGTIWFDTSGGAYFGGSLSAGVLYNSSQSSTIGTSAVAQVGPFGTNGNPKTVVSSFSYNSNAGRLTGNHSSLNGQSVSATIVVERSTNGGTSWTQISTYTATGTISANYESGIGQTHVFYDFSGSVTTTDTNSSTNDFMYRARITASSGSWPMTFHNGQGVQRLTIASTEE